MKKEYRVKKSQDFDNIIRKKQSFANRQFVIYYQENKLDHMRLGISVSKKLGKAHERNRLKRYVRESFKTRKDFLKNYDIIIIVRPAAKGLSFLEFGSSIDHVLKRSKLYRGKRV
ncbi:ribonuclease P protein component [Gemella sanguinis]|jgi:ribonuclease P protein component|uniref:Ribonuclease P protein component n=1 Tax=Gemella sanguinis TaxID=84135 RepID=A0ABX6FGB7_9BACL|nr:ribonuclease P protein component [Gemella sanguinis]EGF88920.1 ribonuclease P protein component [Gemella sanguinis M325]NKZ26478.1 ribonuclease P protein component [Gemella sanguinis]QGS07547.1 ribonuclease P protein component [Gemella sanguinis]